jgi:hypothetical protein
MFSTDYLTNVWIDAIQNAKTTWVNTWVKDEAMSKPLYDFIKVQTEFTKDAMKHTTTFANAAGEAMAKVIK